MTTYPNLSRIDTERELYVIDQGSHVSCLGFDVLRERTAAYAAFAKRPALDPRHVERGSEAAYLCYTIALEAAQRHAETTRERCYAFTNEALRPFRGQRVRVSKPYTTLSGRQVSTFIVGQTTGWAPATLHIGRRGQHGSADVIPPTYDPGHVTPLSR